MFSFRGYIRFAVNFVRQQKYCSCLFKTNTPATRISEKRYCLYHMQLYNYLRIAIKSLIQASQGSSIGAISVRFCPKDSTTAKSQL